MSCKYCHGDQNQAILLSFLFHLFHMSTQKTRLHAPFAYFVRASLKTWMLMAGVGPQQPIGMTKIPPKKALFLTLKTPFSGPKRAF